MFHVPEFFRVKKGVLTSDKSYGNNGAFVIPPSQKNGRWLVAIASDGFGWEHVSIHVIKDGKDYTPYWEEMQEMKLIFWDKDDTVIQFHPPESEYVNNHPHTLHLWRSTTAKIQTPPSILVGIEA